MIDATFLRTFCDLARMASIGVHDPNRGHVARGGAAEDNPLAIGRLAHPKVGRIGRREARDRIIPRIEPAEFRAAARQPAIGTTRLPPSARKRRPGIDAD